METLIRIVNLYCTPAACLHSLHLGAAAGGALMLPVSLSSASDCKGSASPT